MFTEEKQRELLEAFASEPEPISPNEFRWLPVEPLERARIATDLAPRASQHLGNKSRLFVVGHDCPNLTDPSYTDWEKFLVNVCERGCSLVYYLGKKNSALLEKFQKIATLSKARPGQIRVYMRDHLGDRFAESYADQWKTFHFVVFEKPRQLWIETNHPEGSTEAYNCYYLPPSKARNEPLLDICKQRFETVINECSKLEFES